MHRFSLLKHRRRWEINNKLLKSKPANLLGQILKRDSSGRGSLASGIAVQKQFLKMYCTLASLFLMIHWFIIFLKWLDNSHFCLRTWSSLNYSSVCRKKEDQFFCVCLCVWLYKFSCCENFHPLSGSGSSAYRRELTNRHSFRSDSILLEQVKRIWISADLTYWELVNIEHAEGEFNGFVFFVFFCNAKSDFMHR